MTPLAAGAVHTALEWFAIFVGARLYLRTSGTTLRELGATRHYAVILGCIVGAAVGNKAVHWLHHVDNWHLLRQHPWLVLQGQSIVGGLLGGLLGVELGKKSRASRNRPGIASSRRSSPASIIGRIGCFIAGLADDTYGSADHIALGRRFR